MVWPLLKQGITQEVPEIFLVSTINGSTPLKSNLLANLTTGNTLNNEKVKTMLIHEIVPTPEFFADQLEHTSLIDLLELSRPSVQQWQARSPALLGLGLSIGFLGSVLFSKFFSSTTDSQIETLNRNIHKQNKLLELTNERVDILGKNVSDSFDAVKNVLDQLAKNQELSDIHFALL